MTVHIGRNNFVHGTGRPLSAPKYYGQSYIDTLTTPRTLWVSTGTDVSNWLAIAAQKHTHEIKDFVDMEATVSELVQKQGIKASLAAMKDGVNIWTGTNAFDGELRHNGGSVLTSKTSIGELVDVDISENLNVMSLLGFDGSKFVPMKVEGVGLEEGGVVDFSAYSRKEDIVNNLSSNRLDVPLSAAQGAVIKNKIESETAKKDHVHTGYAKEVHEHTQYLDLTKPSNELKGRLTIGDEDVFEPLRLKNQYAEIDFMLPSAQEESVLLSFSGGAGGDIGGVVMGGVDGGSARKLTLNFSEVSVSGGRISIGESSKYLQVPNLSLQSNDLMYVGDSARRQFGLDLNNSAVVGANQIIFGRPSASRLNSIMFPKSHAGNSRPTQAGLYHHLYLSEGEMVTDTALASEQRYINLGGTRYFFGSSEPGKGAREGDVWFKV